MELTREEVYVLKQLLINQGLRRPLTLEEARLLGRVDQSLTESEEN